MIGVIADPKEHDVVREFFELFKTPWEFYRKGEHYDALVCTGDGKFDRVAKVVVHYSGRGIQLDVEKNVKSLPQRKNCILSYQTDRIPIYGDSLTFPEKETAFLTEEDSRSCAAFVDQSNDGVLVRVGYGLFDEVRTLLTVGQPPVNANIPALELHIALLRNLLTGRSEEHTSELQSHLNLVCRLLLEKKNHLLKRPLSIAQKSNHIYIYF